MNEISYKLKGILNGIDTSDFSPEKDSKIYFNYNDLEGKKKNKEAFFKEYDIKSSKSMMIGMVTRLDRQKGLDLVLYSIRDILKLDVVFALLGTGSPEYEATFYDIEKNNHDKARCFIMYDDALARKIYAASDVLSDAVAF